MLARESPLTVCELICTSLEDSVSPSTSSIRRAGAENGFYCASAHDFVVCLRSLSSNVTSASCPWLGERFPGGLCGTPFAMMARRKQRRPPGLEAASSRTYALSAMPGPSGPRRKQLLAARRLSRFVLTAGPARVFRRAGGRIS